MFTILFMLWFYVVTAPNHQSAQEPPPKSLDYF